MIPIFSPVDIGPHLNIADLIPAAEVAFRAVTAGTAQAPVHVLHPNDHADLHVKSAVLEGSPIFTVKMAGWSQVLADRGQPASSGMIAVFESATCRPIAILQDDHLISDFRTAAAGALVARLLAPQDAQSALIVGTGTQASLQAKALLLARPIRQIGIWGRQNEKAAALAADLSGVMPSCRFTPVADLASSARNADIIVTATGATEPILQADWLRPSQHITSVGSDDTTKCELAPECLAMARVFVDSIASAKVFGATHRAIARGALAEGAMTEIGAVIERPSLGRSSDTAITIACLSGLGIQDLAVVSTLWARLTAKDGGAHDP